MDFIKRVRNLWQISAIEPDVIKDLPQIQLGQKAEFITSNRVKEIMESPNPTIDQILIKE